MRLAQPTRTTPALLPRPRRSGRPGRVAPQAARGPPPPAAAPTGTRLITVPGLAKPAASAAAAAAAVHVAGADTPLGASIVRALLAAGVPVDAGVKDVDQAAADVAFLTKIEVINRKEAALLTLTDAAPDRGTVLVVGLAGRAAAAAVADAPRAARVVVVAVNRDADSAAAAVEAARGVAPCVLRLPQIVDTAAGERGQLPAAVGALGTAPPGAALSRGQAADVVVAALAAAPTPTAIFAADVWAKTEVPLIPTRAAVDAAMPTLVIGDAAAALAEQDEKEDGDIKLPPLPSLPSFGRASSEKPAPPKKDEAPPQPSPMAALLGGLKRGVLFSDTEDSGDDDDEEEEDGGPLAWLLRQPKPAGDKAPGKVPPPRARPLPPSPKARPPPPAPKARPPPPAPKARPPPPPPKARPPPPPPRAKPAPPARGGTTAVSSPASTGGGLGALFGFGRPAGTGTTATASQKARPPPPPPPPKAKARPPPPPPKAWPAPPAAKARPAPPKRGGTQPAPEKKKGGGLFGFLSQDTAYIDELE